MNQSSVVEVKYYSLLSAEIMLENVIPNPGPYLV